jgi:hypothetical protein
VRALLCVLDASLLLLRCRRGRGLRPGPARGLGRVLALVAFVGGAITSAAASTTGLSDGIVQRAPGNEASAVFGYDPMTGAWTELNNVTWKPVSSAGHSG